MVFPIASAKLKFFDLIVFGIIGWFYVFLYITSEFRIKTMYVYYIAMKIYVFVCTNIFTFLFFMYNWSVTPFS
jgi:hypothetical protein